MGNEKQGHVVGYDEARQINMERQALSQVGGGNIESPSPLSTNIGTKLDDLYCSVDTLDSEIGQLLDRLQCLMPAMPVSTENDTVKQYEESEFVNRIQTIADKVVTIINVVNEANRVIQI